MGGKLIKEWKHQQEEEIVRQDRRGEEKRGEKTGEKRRGEEGEKTRE